MRKCVYILILCFIVVSSYLRAQEILVLPSNQKPAPVKNKNATPKPAQSSAVHKVKETDDPLNGMVLVQGGTFSMGSNEISVDEKPVHNVTVSSFYISKYEVTFDQYDAYCVATGKQKPSDQGWGRGNRPVINVSFDDAWAYCDWLNQKSGKNFRLPTEAEWEYAARGGIKSRNYTFSGSDNIDAISWYSENSERTTHPVGQKGANELGLCDMSGNVWEWCSDWYDIGYYSHSPSDNPKGPINGTLRVIRGGGWGYDARNCRISYRSINAPDNRSSYVGFRVVCSL